MTTINLAHIVRANIIHPYSEEPSLTNSPDLMLIRQQELAVAEYIRDHYTTKKQEGYQRPN
jgi:hypothetical protein